MKENKWRSNFDIQKFEHKSDLLKFLLPKTLNTAWKKPPSQYF